MATAATQFVLKGFSQETGFRIFVFECHMPDRTRTPLTVKADMALARKYNIALQELPLLCREILERYDQAGGDRTFTYTEDDMARHSTERAARAEASKRKHPPRRPATDNAGAAWRHPPG
ncbi:MAG: hypothetical protein SFV51_30430 [Bryobacteraceae bacterium]|nr:hypothetical protein [Bryobacteraceae bacterium]